MNFGEEQIFGNNIKNICDKFGKNAMSISICERWFAKFKSR